MKTYLAFISATALLLSACSQQEASQPAASSASATQASTSQASAPQASAPAQPAEVAAECSTVVESNDQMKFNVSQII